MGSARSVIASAAGAGATTDAADVAGATGVGAVGATRGAHRSCVVVVALLLLLAIGGAEAAAQTAAAGKAAQTAAAGVEASAATGRAGAAQVAVTETGRRAGAAQTVAEIPLTITVWAVDLNPRPTLTEQQLMERLREQARRGISAMLHGYRFNYTLENRARDITERFVLEPVAEIASGDPRLRLLDLWREDEFRYAQFAYLARGVDAARLAAWRTTPRHPTASGFGSAGVWSEETDKQQAAVTRAVQGALDAHLRATQRSQPQRADGVVLFREGPRVWIESAEYRAHISLYLRVNEIEEYGVF